MKKIAITIVIAFALITGLSSSDVYAGDNGHKHHNNKNGEKHHEQDNRNGKKHRKHLRGFFI